MARLGVRAAVRRAGRVVLWLVVGMLLVRGGRDVLERSDTAVARPLSAARAVAWPDDEARAFAARFARAYLSSSPRDPERRADAIRAFVATDLVDAVVPDVGRHGEPRTVAAVTVARTVALDTDHALLTVAADDGTYLTVPVARDARGGLVVDDLPS